MLKQTILHLVGIKIKNLKIKNTNKKFYADCNESPVRHNNKVKQAVTDAKLHP